MGPLLGRGSRRGREASCWIRTGPGKERSPGSGSTMLPGTDLIPRPGAPAHGRPPMGETEQGVEAAGGLGGSRPGWLPGEGDPAAGRAE